jgi:hypothetical protein
MRKWIVLVFLAQPLQASSNLISSMTWSESGDYKMARQDQIPFVGNSFCSTCTISRIWDGTTIKLFGGKGELLTWVTYLIASAGGDATNVMVTLSSFTGTGAAAGSGFSAVVVSSVNVWDYSQRPYSLYKYAYLQMVGMDGFGAWNPTEYDQYQLPPRWQVPCTLQANGYCSANGGTDLWTSRNDHGKFYPDPAVPMEEYAISSFTVSASSSQAIGGEVYVSTGLMANSTYTATLTVYEGGIVSTTIPVALFVYNAILPPQATLPVVAVLGYSDMDAYLYGNEFPANEQVDPYLTGHLRAAAFLHRHKIITVGDPSTSGRYYPSVDYLKHIDGSAFLEAYGLSYNTGPGYGMGDPIYWAGTYGSWKTIASTFVVSNVGNTGYCNYVSSFTFFCQNHNLQCQMYTGDDEASQTLLGGEVNRWSTWNATSPVCASSGKTLPYLQTGTLPTVFSSAPYVSTVLSTSWLSYSSATWISDEALYNSISTHSVGGYNTGSPGTDSTFAMQEEGLGPREVMWGAYKTNQSQWFLWYINYWIDSNNAGQANNGWNANGSNENDNFNIAKNFGYDSYPSTSAIKGHFGFNFTNKDGLMLYPGTDQVYSNPSFGFNGVVGSWRLNQLTRGIQDVDIIKLAYAVNPASTTAIVNGQVQDVMYLRQCFTLGDCTYSYGVRPWSENLGSWETARERLLQIVSTAVSPNPPTKTFTGQIQINGTVTIQ